jgi:protein-S-isoprenylcysteine O-methyltransferase Ste14
MERVLAVSAAYLTWIPFAVCMRYYFRRYRTANRAKDWLVRCGGVCSLAQMALLPLCDLPAPPLVYVGVAGFVLASGLFWWALATHGRRRPNFAFVPAVPEAFTASGPYRLVRHPIYTAYLLGWLGGTLACGQFWLLALVALMGVFFYRAARQEEVLMLASSLGPQYRAYCRRTGMFLPKVLPLLGRSLKPSDAQAKDSRRAA